MRAIFFTCLSLSDLYLPNCCDKQKPIEMKVTSLFKKNALTGDRLRFSKVKQYLARLIVFALSAPFSYLPEGKIKHGVRMAVLRVQNSVTTRLVVNKGDVVLQIGTPWPETLHRYRRAVGDHGRLVVFEAMEENHRVLRQAVIKAGYTNVTVFHGAAWSERTSGKFMISPHRGDHKIHQEEIVMDNDLRDGNVEMQEVEVQMFTVDEVLADMGITYLDHLSVTVNGAEYEVLRGAENILKQSKNLRVFAKAHARNVDGEPVSSKIVPFLNDLGFGAVITRGEVSSTVDKSWLKRDGDVYAWKTHA